ncbi:hypothetical protein JCM10212_005748 [Sporobolomyces blumeae]
MTPPLDGDSLSSTPPEPTPSCRPPSVRSNSPSPTRPAAPVALDPQSWAHVEALCEQLIKASKLSHEQWNVSLQHGLTMIRDGAGSSAASSSPDQDAWLEVDEMPKVAILSLRVVATNTNTLAKGATARGVSFTADAFEGANLFGRDGPELDDEDLKIVEPYGGTFHLTATGKGLHRLRRLLEFLTFAVITLLLENALLHDLSCPRPLPLPEPEATSDALDSESEIEDADLSIIDADTSFGDPTIHLPGSFGVSLDEEEPDEDWANTRRSWRSGFSNKGILAWMRLANPRAEMPGPRRSRSLRRHSTLPRADRPSEPPEPLADSSGPSESPSPSKSGKRQKLANKMRGIREQLHGRFGLPGRFERGSEDTSDAESVDTILEPEQVEQEASGPGRNVGSLGLQISGLRASPWSPSRQSPVEPNLDATSDIGTEAPAEESRLPPRRFEKVVGDLSRFLLSTSPDVLFPPPHLLFRLRQQELAATTFTSSQPPSQEPSAPPSPSPSLQRLSTAVDERHRAPSYSLRGGLSPLHLNRTSALQHAHALPSTHSLALNLAGDVCSPNEAETRNARLSTSNRITLDVKAGLASLMTNNSSLGGTLRHQSMQFLMQTVSQDAPKGAPPCEPPQWVTFRFFDAGASFDGQTSSVGDVSLELFVERLLERRSRKCPRCDRPHGEHTLVLMHNDEKVEISVVPRDDEVGSTPDSTPGHPSLAHRHLCKFCDASTPATELSPTAASYSFAKYLELVLYDSNLIPVPELCPHAANERLFELRLPTAVDPDVEPDDAFDQLSPDSDSIETLQEEMASKSSSITYAADLFSRKPPDDCTSVDASSLVHLRALFDRWRRDCESSVKGLQPDEVNIGRSAFELRAKAIKQRLSSWEDEHSSDLGPTPDGSPLPRPAFDEPDYFAADVSALPLRSNILVRKNELSSLIALTLSSPEFKEACQAATAASSRRVTPSHPAFVSKSRQSSVRLPIPAFPAQDERDPLESDTPPRDASSTEYFEIVAKPKKTKGGGSVFRNLVRKKSSEILGTSTTPLVTPTSETGTFQLGSKRTVLKDSALDDFLKTKETTPVLDSTSENKPSRSVPSVISGIASRREGSTVATLSLDNDVLAQLSRSGPSAAGSIRSKIGANGSSASSAHGGSGFLSPGGPLAESLDEAEEAQDMDDSLSPLKVATDPNRPSLLDGLRFGIDSLRTRAGGITPRLGGTNRIDGTAVSEHIKLKITQGDTKYSITAYYPRRFKDLRAKCGLSESLFVESLSRCTDLNPDGGKSSSAFFVSGDRRFMLKELVTKLGYSELDSLLTFAPRLLDYLIKPERPSLLAKIFGIYTVKVKNEKTGEKRKLDLVVMEHLFHSQAISRQFDLKGVLDPSEQPEPRLTLSFQGIASRTAKATPGEESTGWDGDWLGSTRDQILLYPAGPRSTLTARSHHTDAFSYLEQHSRTLLLDALSNDVAFLTSNGGIDFSLLVGIDDAQASLSLGLIDTLGVFNTLKIIEHSAKKGIKLALASDASDVTVCPPSEYGSRFLSAMQTYFTAVPDHWSKEPGTSEMESDPRLASPL